MTCIRWCERQIKSAPHYFPFPSLCFPLFPPSFSFFFPSPLNFNQSFFSLWLGLSLNKSFHIYKIQTQSSLVNTNPSSKHKFHAPHHTYTTLLANHRVGRGSSLMIASLMPCLVTIKPPLCYQKLKFEQFEIVNTSRMHTKQGNLTTDKT